MDKKIYKNTNLFDSSTWSKYQKGLNSLADRIEICPSLPWGYITCKTCGYKLTKPVKLTCMSNYCNDKQYVSNQLRIRRMKFKEFNIRSKKLYTFVIGFKDIPSKDLSRGLKNNYEKATKYVLKEIKKSYGSFFYISVRDINKSKSHKDFLRYHHHIATLPLKDFRLFNKTLENACLKASHKFNLTLSYSGGKYQKTMGVISYISKRSVGLFGHNRENETAFSYSDYFTLEKYYQIFYKTKSWTTNFKYRTRTRQRSGFISMLNIIPDICPNCKVSTKNNTCLSTKREAERK